MHRGWEITFVFSAAACCSSLGRLCLLIRGNLLSFPSSQLFNPRDPQKARANARVRLVMWSQPSPSFAAQQIVWFQIQDERDTSRFQMLYSIGD